MDREELRNIIYSVFSDTLMVFLALLVFPIVLAQYLLDLTSTQNGILNLISWIIYGIFVIEFFLKLSVAQEKIAFVKSNKLYTVISLIIIISPLLEPISELFAAAPLLRALRGISVIRLSRLATVLAASGRARLAWKNLNFRTYAIVTSVIAFGFLISFFKPQIEFSALDRGLLSQFLQITATIYAIITGFIIANVWGKYISLVRSVNFEATALRQVYLLSKQMGNAEFVDRLGKTIAHYVEIMVKVHWKGIKQNSSLDKASAGIYESLNLYKPKTAGEVEIYTNLIDELRRSSEGQVGIQSLLASKTPKILWALITVLSAIIIFALFLTNYDTQLLATLTLTMVSTAVALVAVIIYDMNEPFKLGFWAVSPVAYLDLLDFIEEVGTEK